MSALSAALITPSLLPMVKYEISPLKSSYMTLSVSTSFALTVKMDTPCLFSSIQALYSSSTNTGGLSSMFNTVTVTMTLEKSAKLLEEASTVNS